MLIMEINNLKKYYGDRLILKIDNLKIYTKDKIGIVGLNGTGKSTLMDIMAGKTIPDEGNVKLYGSFSYISQGEIHEQEWENKSGGEKTKLKIAEAFSSNMDLLLADEPTANLDLSGIGKLKDLLHSFQGALVLVSHDRDLLDTCCSTIMEMKAGKLRLYKGNYSSYICQKTAEQARKEFEYYEYIRKKNKLMKAALELQGKSSKVRKAPKRMGNSEARLHKMGDQRAKVTLDRSKKALESRLERLEVKEKPGNSERIKLNFTETDILHGRIAAEGSNITKILGGKLLLDNAEFKVYTGTKTAIAGDNGCGKTTLIKMILVGDEGIRVSGASKIGYFAQDFSMLDEKASLLDNVMETTIYDENKSRTLLSRLLFKREDVFKKISSLSGGEKIKAALAKIMLSDFNLLIMDEPTNYLDVYSLEALEKVLWEYNGTLIFVSHDIRFINKLADNIILFKDKKLISYNGNLERYLESKKTGSKNELQKELLVLENKMSELMGRISLLGKKDNLVELNQEYYKVLERLKVLRNLTNNEE